MTANLENVLRSSSSFLRSSDTERKAIQKRLGGGKQSSDASAVDTARLSVLNSEMDIAFKAMMGAHNRFNLLNRNVVQELSDDF